MSSGSRVIAIGDIHGCASELLTLLERLQLTPDTQLIFIGDYVDRGPHSRQVIDLVLEVSDRCPSITLMGNHESMFLDFLGHRDMDSAGLFIFNGGWATLSSYSGPTGDFVIPTDHVLFMEELAPLHQTPDYFFVHAGVPDIPLEEVDPAQDLRDLLWSRDSFIDSDYQWAKTIVHGHTRVERVEILRHRINIDTGCVYNNSLSAIELPSMKVISVPRLDRTRPTVLGDESRRRALRFKGSLKVTVHRGEQQTEFETLDYSQIGMLIRLVTPCERRPLEVGDVVFGTIGKDALGMVKFRGVVIREKSTHDGLYYGVEITHHE